MAGGVVCGVYDGSSTDACWGSCGGVWLMLLYTVQALLLSSYLPTPYKKRLSYDLPVSERPPPPLLKAAIGFLLFGV
jgi:hypothetical protein